MVWEKGVQVKEGIQGEMSNSEDLWKSYWEKAAAVTAEVSKFFTHTYMKGVSFILPYYWSNSASTRHNSLLIQSLKTVTGYLFWKWVSMASIDSLRHYQLPLWLLINLSHKTYWNHKAERKDSAWQNVKCYTTQSSYQVLMFPRLALNLQCEGVTSFSGLLLSR